MSAAAKEDSHPAVKGPSALRSILAGSTAGAVEIGEFSPGNCPPPTAKNHRPNPLTESLFFSAAITYPAECTLHALPPLDTPDTRPTL